MGVDYASFVIMKNSNSQDKLDKILNRNCLYLLNILGILNFVSNEGCQAGASQRVPTIWLCLLVYMLSPSPQWLIFGMCVCCFPLTGSIFIVSFCFCLMYCFYLIMLCFYIPSAVLAHCFVSISFVASQISSSISCLLLHFIPTLSLLLLVCCSHIFHHYVTFGIVSWRSTQLLQLVLLLNVAYDAPGLVIFSSFIIRLVHCHKEIREICMYPVKIKVLHLCC